MRVLADFHIHSRFAMACSSSITVDGIEQACVEKGLNLVGTGDFTHPTWLQELKSTLEPAEQGLFKIKNSNSGVRFVLSGEVSTVYNVNGASKRIHTCILMPDFESAGSLNEALARRGDLKSDGRPQVSMTASELVELAISASKSALVFPAHIWTPYFGALGMKTGFDSIKEAYEDQEKHIYAVEMGLSSNPAMNWRVSELDKYTLLGNSDMHSLPKLGREMNVFEISEKELSFKAFTEAIIKKDKKIFRFVLKFYPEEGKYHFDGHRQCVVSVDPEKHNVTMCPVCGKRLVVGVMHRVNDLADRPPGFVPNGSIPYISAVPLREVIAYVTRKSETSVAVEKAYKELISNTTEFDVLASMPIEEITKNSGPEVAQAIRNVRENKVTIVPGYDGIYGKVDLLNRESKADMSSNWKQKGLKQFEEAS